MAPLPVVTANASSRTQINLGNFAVFKICTPSKHEKMLVNQGTLRLSALARYFLLYGDGFGQIPRLVYVAAAADGYVVGEELEGDDFADGEE